MQDFSYHRPSSTSEAAQLVKSNDEGKFLGGGMSLVPVMKLDLAQPSALISLSGLNELKGIRMDGTTLVVGAMTTHAEVASSDVVRVNFPGLAAMAEGIGDPQVRNRGTIGGSVAHADPAADYPAALVGLNATIKTDQRTISAEDFFQGMFETALQDGELITEVHFPKPMKSAYGKFANPASKYAMVGVYVAQFADHVRVAVTGAATKIFRVPAMESALAANFSPDAIANITVPAANMTGDADAGPEYRAHLVTVMAKRAVKAAS